MSPASVSCGCRALPWETEEKRVRRVVDTILLGLDRNRFPWVAEDREPTEAERGAAAMASAALIASRRVAS